MSFFLYLLVIFLAILSNSFITMILITLRVGIVFCNDIIYNDFEEVEKIAATKLIKKYYLSLVIDILIVLVISCIVILFLNKYLITYLSSLLFLVLFSFTKTGKNNANNVQDFYNGLRANYPNYTEK